MRYTKYPIKTLKETPHDADNIATALLLRAGFIAKEAAGIYSFLPMGLQVIKNIENIIREEMNKLGAVEILMPALHPKEVWEQTGRWDSFDALYRLKSKNDQDFALGATHEEIVTPLMKKMIKSYRDLEEKNVAVYQIQTKFRDETRAKSGLMRGREFIMKDLYSFHSGEADLDVYYEKVKSSYEEIYRRLGIGDQTYLTYASGGAFSKYSHEFQTAVESGEDEIYFDRGAGFAVNREIVDEEIKGFNKASADVIKASEVGNIFKLMTRFSEPFGLNFEGETNAQKPVIMGCYGMGVSRLMGVVAEVMRDERGLVWPGSIAPYSVYLARLGTTQETKDMANQIYENLVRAGISVFYDDRTESPGVKFADADLFGFPYRVVVSDKSLAAGGVEVKERTGADSQIMSEDELVKLLKS